MPDQVFLTLSPSHTKGRMVELIISPEYLADGERVLIIDDFLASGATILGLVRLATAAGARILGVGALIEKSFKGGRIVLSHPASQSNRLPVSNQCTRDKSASQTDRFSRQLIWIIDD